MILLLCGGTQSIQVRSFGHYDSFEFTDKHILLYFSADEAEVTQEIIVRDTVNGGRPWTREDLGGANKQITITNFVS